jgi:predicted RNA-binding protein with TRAM domain
MNEQQEAPVKEGQTYDVSISSVGAKGDGIAKVKGFVLFVPNVKKGDYVKIKVNKVLKNSGFAELVEKLERPKKVKKFETVSMEEFKKEEEQLPNQDQYDDTDDFGAELDEE